MVGSLAILLLARIARRMTRSTLLGCVAGLLLALDGLEFVMSRTALLDIFLMFWVLAAFGCLVVDRDVYPRPGWPRPPRPRHRNRAPPAHRGRVSAGGGLAPGSAWGWPGLQVGRRSGTCPRSPRLVFAWDIGARRAAGLPARLPAARLHR